MNAYLIYIKDRLRSSFWFLPGMMTLGAIVVAIVMLWADTTAWSVRVFWWLGVSSAGAEGARLVLSTIAGSMMTVASLVFSMTLVALTLAAGNIGPRLIDRFMDNRINQTALGLFVATFVYSLLVLRATTGGEAPFIPHLSVALAMVLALSSFGWLIIFIHDLAHSIQVDNVVAKVAGELEADFRSLATQYPEASAMPNDKPMPGAPIHAEASGYLQAIDPKALLALACAHDVIIQMRHRPGHFVIPSTVLAYVAGPVNGELGDGLRKAMVFGPKRTATQDSAFSIDLIVEIAARALSPGVNDFYTALACIDHLTAALDIALQHGLPGNGFQDESGRPRLTLVPITVEGLLDTAFHPLRQTGCDNVQVTLRLLDRLAMLAEGRPESGAMEAIQRHGDLIYKAAVDHLLTDCDRQAINDKFASLQALR